MPDGFSRSESAIVDVPLMLVPIFANVATLRGASFYAAESGSELSIANNASLFVGRARVWQWWQSLFAAMRSVTRSAKCHQVCQIVVAANPERNDVMHIKGSLVFVRGLTALLAYPVSFANCAGQLRPFASITSHSSGIDPSRHSPLALPCPHMVNGIKESFGFIGREVTNSNRIDCPTPTKTLNIAPPASPLSSGQSSPRVLADTRPTSASDESFRTACRDRTLFPADSTDDRDTACLQAVVTANIWSWLTLCISSGGIVAIRDFGLTTATALTKSVWNCIVWVRHFWSSLQDLRCAAPLTVPAVQGFSLPELYQIWVS